MSDYDMVQATIIMMASIALSLVLLYSGGAIADEIDYRTYSEDTGDHAIWASVEHRIHDWVYAFVFIMNLVVIVWWCKCLIRKLGYNRLQQWG